MTIQSKKTNTYSKAIPIMIFFKLKNFLRHHYLLLVIGVVGFCLRAYMAIKETYLHPWDERFHALVARNMIHSPFVPLLRARPISDDYDRFMWCCNHIWLHKQPLFMWQMALSMKIFGVSEWSMRLPSVLMGTLMIFLLYRIVQLTTHNKITALLSALILSFSCFHIQMISGYRGMDHNDVAHGFYILASLWAYIEYTRKPTWYWILLIGIFSGAAILNKWLTGLLVFLPWGLSVLSKLKDFKLFKKEVIKITAALIVCLLVFMPWQIYITHTFPDLAAHEYEFNRRHLTEALEGHSGGNDYFYLALPLLIGKYIVWLIPVGILIAFCQRDSIKKRIAADLLLCLIFVFCFFSFIVATKVNTHLYFVVPIAIMFIAIASSSIFGLLPNLVDKISLIVIIAYFSLNPDFFKHHFSSKNIERNSRLYNADIYRNVKKWIPEDVKVVMNTNSFEDIDVMFYNNDITAYHWTLTEKEFKEFEEQKIKIAVFEPRGEYNLPNHVLSYPYIHIIKQKLR